MVTIGGVESAPPLPRGKEDILKAAGIRVKPQREFQKLPQCDVCQNKTIFRSLSRRGVPVQCFGCTIKYPEAQITRCNHQQVRNRSNMHIAAHCIRDNFA